MSGYHDWPLLKLRPMCSACAPFMLDLPSLSSQIQICVSTCSACCAGTPAATTFAIVLKEHACLTTIVASCILHTAAVQLYSCESTSHCVVHGHVISTALWIYQGLAEDSMMYRRTLSEHVIPVKGAILVCRFNRFAQDSTLTAKA